ncbi:MAG: response regulator [Myxococcota bacterium]
METIRLTESLSIDPENSDVRVALEAHLDRVAEDARAGGFPALEAALRSAAQNLVAADYARDAVQAVRMLAWRYEALAGEGQASGTRPVVREGSPGPVSPAAALRGRRVLLADDDSQVRWFYVGVLREAGARVLEARDGRHALALARESPPELILADIVMPRLDGIGLCAAVRREPRLDGIPIVMLSWRDDFLDRMRELGVEAQDYLRKELPAEQFLVRVGAVLEPLRQLEGALRTEGEARGDLADIGLSRLLRAVNKTRPDANVVLQDPWSLFELAFRDGRLVAVSRTTVDGRVFEGAPVLKTLAGMNRGRFVVARSADPIGDAGGPFDEALEAAMQRLGSLIGALAESGAAELDFDDDALETFLRHSPSGVRDVVQRLRESERVDQAASRFGGSRAELDALLRTLARQGAVVAVRLDGAEADGDARHEQTDGDADLLNASPAATRENHRAQSAVAMHQQPTNRVARSSDVIWRRPTARAAGTEPGSSFVPQTTWATRLLGWGFALVFVGTVAFLLWPRGQIHDPSSATTPRAALERVPAPVQMGGEQGVRGRSPFAVAGLLVDGVDDSLAALPDQGALELLGPTDVAVQVDGVSQGSLPLRLVLDEGRHLVRYGSGTRWTYRLYFVKRGATRTLRVRVEPGGFVDAR